MAPKPKRERLVSEVAFGAGATVYSAPFIIDAPEASFFVLVDQAGTAVVQRGAADGTWHDQRATAPVIDAGEEQVHLVLYQLRQARIRYTNTSGASGTLRVEATTGYAGTG